MKRPIGRIANTSKALISQSRTWEGASRIFRGDSERDVFSIRFHLLHVSLLIYVEGGEDGLRGIARDRFIHHCSLHSSYECVPLREPREIEAGIVGEKIDIHHLVNWR